MEAQPDTKAQGQTERKLLSDRSFLAMVGTQFLGAFNDNAFKQMVALLSVELTMRQKGASIQAIAMALFSLPFVLFSGLAGTLADRFSKTRVIVLAKLAEILIMALAVLGFWLESVELLLGALFLMGTQSAFFGPAKYGILPEMLPRVHLSRANGVILMTTFVSIILGNAAAGFARDEYSNAAYVPAFGCIFLACMGTFASLGIRRLPPARPALKVRGKLLGDLLPTLRWIFNDPIFVLVIIANSFFWFAGGVVMQTINRYGLDLMKLSNEATSWLLVTLSAGIALGSVLGGLLSKRTINFQLSKWGLYGLALGLTMLTFAYRHEWLTHLTLLELGISAGMFGLPLQTFVQLRPPEGEKGRVVAAANFVNWIFIFLSAGYYYLFTALAVPIPWIPASLVVLTLLLGAALIPRLDRIAKVV